MIVRTVYSTRSALRNSSKNFLSKVRERTLYASMIVDWFDVGFFFLFSFCKVLLWLIRYRWQSYNQLFWIPRRYCSEYSRKFGKSTRSGFWDVSECDPYCLTANLFPARYDVSRSDSLEKKELITWIEALVNISSLWLTIWPKSVSVRCCWHVYPRSRWKRWSENDRRRYHETWCE